MERMKVAEMIELKNVVKNYKDGDKTISALNEVNLKLEDNEFLVVLGPSGSGKSTLINIMSALDRSDLGQVLYDGVDICGLKEEKLTRFRRENIGFIFQAYYLLPDLNVENNIRMGANLIGNRSYEDIIEMLDLKEMGKRMPYQLSGGQQQRVAIARALTKKPKVLFCDEPTGALDEKTGKQVLTLLQNYRKKYNITIVMVTHNTGIAEMATRIVRMNSGNIMEDRKNEKILDAANVRWA